MVEFQPLALKFRPQKFSDVVGQSMVKKVLIGMLTANRVGVSYIFAGPRGTGKCVIGSTWIRMREGLRQIKDLFLNPKKGFNSYLGTVFAGGNFENTSHFYFSGLCLTVGLKFDLGFSLEGTFNHKLLVCAGDSYIWKDLGSVVIGDKVKLDLKAVPSFSRSSLMWTYFSEKHKILSMCGRGLTYSQIGESLGRHASYVGRRVRGEVFRESVFSVLVDVDLGYFMGLMVGDGSYKNKIVFSSTDRGLLDFVRSYFEKHFCKVLEYKDNRNSVINVQPRRGKWCKEIFRSAGILGQSSSTKTVPSFIRMGSWDVQKAFVQGVMDTDGSVDLRQGVVELGMYAEDVVRFVQQILLADGLRSRLTRKGKCWRLSVEKSEGVKNYFRLSSKLGRLPLSSRHYKTKDYVVVTEIFKGKDLVYDLTIPKSHSFVSNGVVSHNTSMARIFAKALNCTARSGVEPCCECKVCVDIARSRSADVIEVDSASSGTVAAVRGMRESSHFRTMGGGYRVWILDEVHSTSREGFNALLKIMEEPPPKVVFILATTEVTKVPETILSRCYQLPFRAITIADMLIRLKDVVRLERVEVDDSMLGLIAQKGGGSIRDCLTLLDQLMAIYGKDLTKSEVLQAVGVGVYPEVGELLIEIFVNEPESVLKRFRKVWNLIPDSREFVQMVAEHLKNVGFVSMGLDSYVPAADLALTKRLYNKLDKGMPELLVSVSLLERGLQYTRLNPQVLIEMWLMSLFSKERISKLVDPVAVEGFWDELK